MTAEQALAQAIWSLNEDRPPLSNRHEADDLAASVLAAIRDLGWTVARTEHAADGCMLWVPGMVRCGLPEPDHAPQGRRRHKYLPPFEAQP